ncbi:N,N-dimethylformamidase beta subunit family domain-containing protein [Nocardioides sp. MAHUQ-72]|uniref:N,N-dimethylformamidase beta subunit family domain-containing protein n=1 Tax=unclassified Nocardioides TaxID=2615069 RepID=UPI00360F3A0A
MAAGRTSRRGTTRPRALLWLLAAVLVITGLGVVSPTPAVAAPCDAPVVSPVACENTKPGNPQSEWGVTGAGSSTIQGFATQMSVNVGDTEGFKIDTPATSYRLDIYRMGYYGGLGARKITTVNPTNIVRNQPSCLNDASTGLVDCGNWAQNATWTVPADAVSGIYFARLVRTDGTTGASHVFFVVRNDSSASKLLFQTSDTTWQAYNQYGGNSLYVGSPAGRAYKVSYNRPFTTRDTGPEDFVFNSEYPMVRYLEANGYDVSYTSGADTDRRGAELREHQVFLSVGHDEYWSGQQRANVEAARDAGVNLAFFSGNEIFWKTRWENSIDGSGTPYRTLVSYKETHDNARTDPQDPPTWTGTWRDPRFSPPADGGRPENALSGTIFTSNCCAINMVVGSADGKMRFWRNTSVANLGANQTATIGSNVIGYEWDQDADNGSRPPGLIRLSQTNGSAQVLQDQGSTYASGTATHSMTLYRAASGALVFGAGTIQWPWALDSTHDRGSAAASTPARQATVNLFADMGVQPTTLQTGLTAATTSTDRTAPTSTITAPADGANVPAGSQVTVTGTASDTGGRVGGIEVTTDGGTTWHRATGRESWTYTFTPDAGTTLKIRSRAADDSGNIEAPKPGITVTAGGGGGSTTCPCTIWPSSAVPQGTDPDTSPVELGVKFRAAQNGSITGIRYYKPTQATGTHVGTLWTGTGTKLATATFTNETASGWQQASFATPVPVTANTTYVASYFAPSRYAVSSAYFTSAVTNGPLTALRDGTDGGNGVYRYGTTAGSFPTSTFNSENYWVDVVYDNGPDTTKPTLSNRSPASGATNVAVGVAPTATFSEPVTASTVTFTLKNPAGTTVTATTAYDAATRTATLTPGAPLQPSTTYTAAVSGATDAAGNVMDPDTWTFTTAAADTTKPTVTARTPAAGATNVATSVAPSATFSEPVAASSVAFTLKNPAGTTVSGTTAYDSATRTATLTPSTGLQPSTTYTASVSGASDPSGNVMDPVTWTFTTAATTSACPCTIWPSTATPAATDPDTSAVELGVKFRASQDGYITGIRYYKPTATSGTHVGSLWTSTGTRLASVSFTNESASGWQQATFASPVPVTANTTYVASYFTPSRYVVTSAYFATAATTRGPLTALQNGVDGGNGVYRYTSTAGAFPNSSYNSENYWVDVVFQESANDTSAPTLQDRTPAANATGVPTNTLVTATYNEALRAGSASVEVRNPSGTLVAGTTTLDTSNTRVVFQPGAALQSSTTYTVQVSGAADASGNTAATTTWTFQTAAPAPPAPDQGPGGPIAVVTSAANPVSTYLAEILRAEGLDEFTTIGPAGITATALASYGAVVVGDVAVTDAQVADLTDWVNAGGDLVLMRPDSRFLPLAGLTAQAGTVNDGYLAVDATTPPGAGITTETMQFHGTANRYALAGATSIATLYSSATASTGQPAVAWRSVGSNGGQVATFAYDLARSVVLTHQGNQAWAGQERDGQAPIRPDDLFFGGAGATDWVNLSKVHIPQADEQQRLLANLLTVMRRDRMPLPRFWYFPGTDKAVVVATGDDHGNGGTAGRFDSYLASSPAGCSVAAWTCPRFTSYVYTSTALTNAQASTYAGQGFEVALHHTTDCGDFTSLSSLQSSYSSQLATWRAKYSTLPAPTTNRTHCLVFSDWSSQPRAELANGIRLDTNYYYWPGTWVQDRPGFMNGSGIPMRFTGTDGSLIDVYQTQTAMTDESNQSYPFTPDTLLDRALGPLGYYGAFTANVHTDAATTFESSQLLASAQARGVPLVTARQMLAWVDGRNGSSFGDLAWSGNTLSFSIAVGAGASRLTAMVPTSGPGGTTLTGVARGGTTVAFTRMTVKGQEYAMFPASAGAWTATYAASGTPAPSAIRVASDADGTSVAWATSTPSSTRVVVGTAPGALAPVASTANSTTRHRVDLPGLRPGTTYRYRVVSRAPDGTTRAWPSRREPPAMFRTPRADTTRPRVAQVQALPLPDGTVRVTWRTDERSASEVRFARHGDLVLESRRDDREVTRHEVELTGLDPRTRYRFVVGSTDEAGNHGSGALRAFRTPAGGVAMQTTEDFRTGRTAGDLRVGTAGFGSLVLPHGGHGSFVSPVLDAQLRTTWHQAVIQHSAPPRGSRLALEVRTGDRSTPNGTWTSWRRVRPSQLHLPGRYLQYRLRVTAPTGSAYSVTAVGFSHRGRALRAPGEVS